MSRIKFAFLLLIVSVLGILVGCSGLAGNPKIVSTVPPRATSAPLASVPIANPSLALGEQVFATNCTRCHGLTGKGDGEFVQSGQIATEMIDFTLPESNDTMTPAERFEIITNGKIEALMPPWGQSLSEAERWSVAMYVHSLSYTPDELAHGAEVFAAECADCHGENGKGTSDGAALFDLYSQSDTQLLTQVNNGSGEDMPAFADKLSEQDRLAVVSYVRTISISGEPSQVVASAPQVDSSAPQVESAAPSIGAVTGSVILGTSGSVLPEDLVAKLHVFDSDFNDTTIEVPVNADGSYTFENVSFDAEHAFVVSVVYEGGSFVSDFKSGSSTITSLELPITVYDLTYDSAVLRVASVTTQIYEHDSDLQVIEIVELWNDSDRIYMGTSADDDIGNLSQTVSLTLPENARYVDMTGEGRYNLSEDGRQVIDSLPVLPGEPHTFHMTYTIPYDGSTDVIQKLDYPLDGRVEVQVSAPTLEVESDMLSPLGAFTDGSMTFNSYSALVSFPAGSQLSFELVRSSAAATTTKGDSRSLIAGALMTFGVGMVVGSGFLFWRERRNKAGSSQPETMESLMKQIAEMDLRYQAGELNEKTYQKQRARLKEKVAALVKQQKSK